MLGNIVLRLLRRKKLVNMHTGTRLTIQVKYVYGSALVFLVVYKHKNTTQYVHEYMAIHCPLTPVLKGYIKHNHNKAFGQQCKIRL